MALGTQPPVALAGRGQATQLAVLVDGLAEPVHAGVLRELRIENSRSADSVGKQERDMVNLSKKLPSDQSLTLRMALWAGSTRMTS